MAEDVSLQLQVDVAGALKSLNTFAEQSNKSLKSVEVSVGSLNTKILAGLGIAVANEVIKAFEAIAGAGLKAFDAITTASAQSEAAITKMEIALKLSGDYTTTAASGFRSFAEQMQRTTTYTDEAILKGVALSKTYGATNEQTKKLVTAAADLASVTGVSLDEAVTQLGKTLDGTAGRLNEQIPALRNMTAAQLQAGAAVDYVSQRFRGAAAASAGTYEGSIIRARNAFDDLLKTLGAYITNNSYVLAAINKATDLFFKFGDILKQNDATLRSLAKGGVLAVIDASILLVKVVGVLDEAIYKIRGFIRQFTSLPEILSIVSNAIAGLDFSHISKDIGKINQELADGMSKDKVGLDERAKLIDAMKKAIEEYRGEVVKAGDAQVLSAHRASDAIANQIAALRKLNEEQGKRAADFGQTNPLGVLFKSASNPINQYLAEADQKLKGLNETLLELMKDGPSKESEAVQKAIRESGENIASAKNAQFVGVGAGLLDSISKGAAGAAKVVSDVFGQVADKILPGIGGAVSSIVSLLAQGPDKVREFVDTFVDAIPVIVKNIIEAVPVLITELLRKIPDVINALIDQIPEFIDAFIAHIPDLIDALIAATPKWFEAMTFEAPKVVLKMVENAPRIITEMIRGIPDVMKKFAEEFLKIPAQFVAKLFEQLESSLSGGLLGGGGGAGGILGGGLGVALNPLTAITSPIQSFGHAVGLDKLFSHHDDAPIPIAPPVRDVSGVGGYGGTSSRGYAQSDGGQPLHVNVVIGEQQLASVMLNLNRRGFRLS